MRPRWSPGPTLAHQVQLRQTNRTTTGAGHRLMGGAGSPTGALRASTRSKRHRSSCRLGYASRLARATDRSGSQNERGRCLSAQLTAVVRDRQGERARARRTSRTARAPPHARRQRRPAASPRFRAITPATTSALSLRGFSLRATERRSNARAGASNHVDPAIAVSRAASQGSARESAGTSAAAITAASLRLETRLASGGRSSLTRIASPRQATPAPPSAGISQNQSTDPWTIQYRAAANAAHASPAASDDRERCARMNTRNPAPSHPRTRRAPTMPVSESTRKKKLCGYSGSSFV